MPLRSVALGVLALALSACAVGPAYVGPPDTTLHGLRNVAALAVNKDTAGVSLDTWWTGFNDPELTKIIHRALDQNLDLAASLARVEQARAVAHAAEAKLLPTIDANADVTRVHSSDESRVGLIGRNLPGYHRDETFYDVGAGASWEFDLFGGLRRGKEAARAEVQAAEAARLGVRISVTADAADAYFQIRGYQARLAVAQTQIETDERLFELVKIRRTYGVATDREVAQAEALMRNARATIPPLRIGLEAQSNRLDVLVGTQAGTYAAELSEPAVIPAIPAISSSQSADLLHRRPDIIAAERRLAASSAAIGAAVSDYYPKISLSGLLGFESTDISHLFRATTFQPTAVGGLRWRLFDFGRVDAEVEQAKGVHAEALALYKQSVLQATEDVEDAFMSLAQNEMQMEEVTKEEAALVRAHDLAEADYKAGAASLTDVLDANRQLLATRDELAQTRAYTDRAAVATFRALGGGW